VPPAIEVMRHVGHGRIYQQIIEIAGEVEADLIVMAATNEEGSAYQLGPSTAWVARHAGCSVLIVRT
jgi:nucleotide-binding universal stress UspA family protein